jgi:hypothetical protein
MPDVVFAKDDIRFDHALGGGAMMDMGCTCFATWTACWVLSVGCSPGYTMSVIRYLGGAPTEVLSATHTLRSALVDRRTDAHLALASGATAKLTCDLAVPLTYGVLPGMPSILAVVKGERGEASLLNFLMPTIYHTLSVTKTDGGSSQKRTEKVYVADGRGEPSWTTCAVSNIAGALDSLHTILGTATSSSALWTRSAAANPPHGCRRRTPLRTCIGSKRCTRRQVYSKSE